jgi:two-component system, OmpR family, sensor histidine kinase KdpD
LKRQASDRWKAYLVGIGLVVGATILGELLKTIPYFNPTNMDMLYLLFLVISVFYLGLGPSIMVSVLSVLAFDFFFLLPLYTLATEDVQGTLNLLILFVVSIAIVQLSQWNR